MKKVLVLCMAVLMCFVCGCDNKTTENKATNNNAVAPQTSNGLGPFKLVAGKIADNQLTSSIKLSDTSFTVEDDKSTFKTTVANTADAKVTVAEIDIIIKNASGDEIITLRTFINDLEAKESKTVETSVGSKLEGFATIEYKVLEQAQ